MHKVKSIVIDLMLLFIITAPAFFIILNNRYFSMHDDQHIARLFLLDQGIRQGYLYPRWVDGLGFGFGYPLYNFYPPLIYYLGEFFHLIGFSLIWSVKLTFITGFYLGAIGIYSLVKKHTGRFAGFLSATLYTYFFYHAVLIYVRGALAEFFSLAVMPFVFLTFTNLAEKNNWRNTLLFALSFAALILCHPLIALPSVIFLGIYFIFYLINSRNKASYAGFSILAGVLSLGLSAFFWLPSIVERKYTLTDLILTGELASYKLHYIYPQQFIYSPWGYGGSGAGLADGVTFQLGKIHIGLAVLSFILFLIALVRNKKNILTANYYLLTAFLLFFSLFMTTEYSAFIWDRIQYLWYLQFPWRYLTFTTVFISILGGYSVYFLSGLLEQSSTPARWRRLLKGSITAVFVTLTIFIYQKYFHPQRFINTSDRERISFEEVAWRISRTSYEFVPKGVRTKKTELNTTIPDIDKINLPVRPFEIISGRAGVSVKENKFGIKKFTVDASTPLTFRLNTYNFPGWTAYLDDKTVRIDGANDLKLITLNIPPGNHTLKFIFENTAIRNLADLISVSSLIILLILFGKKFKKVDR